MRIIILQFLFIILLLQCGDKNINNDDLPDVVLEFLKTEINQKGMDMRILNPPLPPESKNKKDYGSGIKPDSVINKLSPLKIYINDSISYEKKFKLKLNPINGFSFIKDSSLAQNSNPIYLDISHLDEKKGILLISIGDKTFFDSYESFRLNNDYGGIISFQNLYFSHNGTKAYFEVNYFKGPLNASFVAIFAEYKNGKWHFKSELISIA